MNDIEQKRSFVTSLYPGQHWKDKVSKMADDQVIAIYLKERNKPKREEKPKESKTNEQLPLF